MRRRIVPTAALPARTAVHSDESIQNIYQTIENQRSRVLLALLGSPSRVCLAAVVIRCVSALICAQTFFAPDEFWQGPEVIHAHLFGIPRILFTSNTSLNGNDDWIRAQDPPLACVIGVDRDAIGSFGAQGGENCVLGADQDSTGMAFAPLTWEWRRDVALRSYAHPLLVGILPYGLLWLLETLNFVDYSGSVARWIAAFGPAIVQALLSAVADVCMFVLAERVLRSRVGAAWTVAASFCNWFAFYTMGRTLSNSAEAALTLIALCLWPVGFIYISSPRPSSATVGSLASTHRGKGGVGGDGGGGVDVSAQGIAAADAPFLLPSVVPRSYLVAIAVAALSIVVRPTAAVTWLWLGSLYAISVARARGMGAFILVISSSASIVALVLLFAACVDGYMYGSSDQLMFTLGNFVKFNVVRGAGSFYGTHVWHWYLSQGLPAILGPTLVAVLAGVRWFAAVDDPEQRRSLAILASTTALGIAVFSFLGHKEFRFILPQLLLLMPFAGAGLRWLWSLPVLFRPRRRWYAKWGPAVALVALLANVPILIYLSSVHQSGPAGVMQVLDSSVPPNSTVHLWLPCHHTALYSRFHRAVRDNITLFYWDCSPPGDDAWCGNSSEAPRDAAGRCDLGRYMDQAEQFKSDPAGFVERFYSPARGSGSSLAHYSGLSRQWPDFVVIYDTYASDLATWLTWHRYEQLATVFHAHTPPSSVEDGLVGSVNFLVYKRR